MSKQRVFSKLTAPACCIPQALKPLTSYHLPIPQRYRKYIVQTIYYTNNAAAPPAFYQCADIQIFAPNATAAAKKNVHQH